MSYRAPSSIPRASEALAQSIASLKKTALYEKVVDAITEASTRHEFEISVTDVVPPILKKHLEDLGYSIHFRHNSTVISWLHADKDEDQ
jgi:hypothetical protein